MNEQAVLIATAEAAVAAGDSRPEDRIVDGVAPFTAAAAMPAANTMRVTTRRSFVHVPIALVRIYCLLLSQRAGVKSRLLSYFSKALKAEGP